MFDSIIGRVMYHIQRASVKGKKFFHKRCMRWSYRNRGYDARIHKNREVNVRALIVKLSVKSSGFRIILEGPRKTTEVRAFIMIILVYSAMKNKAKGPAAYSTLKPDTSSDSPSVKSNGARLVSAKVEINHIIASGHVGMISQIDSWVCINMRRVKDPLSISTDKIIIARVTS